MAWFYLVVSMEDGKKQMKINILYEDNHLLVVEKPINILSQGDNTKDKDLLNLLKEYLKEKYHKPGNVYLGLVHRLDRPVGGIMVFAKTSKAATRLTKQITNHEMKKTYLAIVQGIIQEEKGTYQDKIERLPNGNSQISEKGKIALLEYEVLERNEKKKKTLVKIFLKTGRHHQIRVQFASHHHPLCGDQRYGKEDKTQIALYAYRLEFTHPTTKEHLTFQLTPPKIDHWTEFTLSRYVQ